MVSHLSIFAVLTAYVQKMTMHFPLRHVVRRKTSSSRSGRSITFRSLVAPRTGSARVLTFLTMPSVRCPLFWQRIYSCHFDRLCERGMCPWILALVQEVCGVAALYYPDRHMKYCAFLTNCIICITKDVYHHRIPLIVSVLGKTDGTQDQWAQCRRRTHEASRLAMTDVRRELEDRDCLVWPK